MKYAKVIPDIPTRSLDKSFDYLIPAELNSSCALGCTVLVSFGHRDAVGYVIGLTNSSTEGMEGKRLLPIQSVLTEPVFNKLSLRLAEWMAKEYAAPLVSCLRLLLPPGQTMHVKQEDEGIWTLVCERAKAIDDRWVSLAPRALQFIPKANACRQRRVLEALEAGPQRLAELSAMVPGASSVVSSLAKQGVVNVEHRRKIRGSQDATTLSSARASRPETLTFGQTEALHAISKAIEEEAGDVVLIDGVTGSGKTEVYLHAIEDVIARGKGAIVLVPEISLTAQTVGRFRNRFGDSVAILHSRLSVGERYDQWDLVRTSSARVVVGARSALFAPMENVGLIVIDEEHELSYKQDKAPRYHTREAAAHLARLHGAALVLGSATPSLESLERCRNASWRQACWTRIEMPERPGTSILPKAHIVDMRTEFANKNHSVFSRALKKALLQVVEKREKAVLLLNRRGFASFLMCRECGCVPSCTHCSTALTYHERTHSLMCHSCGRSWSVLAYPNPATKCPNCSGRYLAQFGLGTQRVEDELKELLGDSASIIRMDADTTSTKGAHTRLLEEFDSSECAVLIGTQMIAKGLDFPEVTLVGVVNADTTLKLADFRAAERTYDLLEQVAGRAGRGEREGQVIIQTYWPTHPAIAAVGAHRRTDFEEYELDQRREMYYPPYSRLGRIVVSGKNEHAVREYCDNIAHELLKHAKKNDLWEVLGPASCLKAKIKDRYRRHVLVKAPLNSNLGAVLEASVSHLVKDKSIRISIDVDAYDLM